MNINIDRLVPVALPRHFILTVYPNGDYKITERKATSRDKQGHYTSDYSIRFRKPKNLGCAYAEICPFRASTSIEEL